MQRIRQAADVVVRFDGVRFFVFGARRFDHVGVNGALCQPFCPRQLGGLTLKHLDKLAPDNFSFLFRVRYAAQMPHEFCTGIYVDDLHAQIFGEGLHDLCGLIQPQ